MLDRMLRVIPLIEDLLAAGVEVPPYPDIHAPLAESELSHLDADAQVQAKVDAFERRVVAWRADVTALHAKHFPTRISF